MALFQHGPDGKVLIIRPWIFNVALIVMIASVSPLSSQPMRELYGSIMDATGAVIPAAAVKLEDGKGHRHQVVADAVGQYRLTGLPAGSFMLYVTSTGFAPFTAPVVLRESVTGPFNITLQVRNIKEEVNVTSEVGLSAEEGLFSLILSGPDLESLPSGPAGIVERLREMTGSSDRPGDFTVYVDGFRPLRLPPKEMIQMVRITWNPFAPEFAEPGRVRVDIVTKPGGGKFHGDFGGTYNPPEVNASNNFANSPSPGRTRNYSGYLSGPIVKDRLSFTAWAGQWALDTVGVINARVLNPVTLEPEPLVTTVPTPSRITSGWFGVNSQLGRSNTMAVSLSETRDKAQNQGLDGGLDLQDRGYSRSIRDDDFQLSLSSVGRAVLNEIRLEASRHAVRSTAQGTGPAIEVLDAFNSGANQAFLQTDNRMDALRFSDHMTISRRRGSFKLGVDVDEIRSRDLDRTDFGGTFVFGSDVERDPLGKPVLDDHGLSIPITPLETYRRTLLQLPGYGPSQFTIVRGDPRIDFRQSWVSWFAQHDWAVGRGFSLLYGVRHEIQALVPSRTNFAPRAGFAWGIDESRKNVIRGSAGIFFQRLDSNIVRDIRRFDGVNRQRFVIQQPSFFPNTVNPVDGAAVTTAIQVLGDRLRAPRIFATTLGYERKLGKTVVGISFTRERGQNLMRTRNVNAPVGGPSRPQPFPEFGPILQYESSGLSRRHELLMTFQTNETRRVSVVGNYSLSWLQSDTDGPTTQPADSYGLSAEFGPGKDDRRHRGSIGASVRLPGGLMITPFLTAMSPQPFNITTGSDNNGDSLFTDRPAFGQPGDPGVVATPYGLFNPNPKPGDPIIPRDFGREANQVRLDLRISKTFPLVGGATINFSANGENVLNRANVAGFNGVLTSPVFGQPNRALNPRRIEFGTRISF